MKSIELLSWVYDIKTNSIGVRFVLFRNWTIYFLPFENIKSVSEVSYCSIGSISAYNFKNRFFTRTFMIEVRQGWFAHKVLVTPKEPVEFLAVLKSNGIA